MKRRLERIFAGLLAALTLCLRPCFAGAAPPEAASAAPAERFCKADGEARIRSAGAYGTRQRGR